MGGGWSVVSDPDTAEVLLDGRIRSERGDP